MHVAEAVQLLPFGMDVGARIEAVGGADPGGADKDPLQRRPPCRGRRDEAEIQLQVHPSGVADARVRNCREVGRTGLPRTGLDGVEIDRSEEHTSELQSLMRISYAVFCLKKTKRI